jgi:hypothetical protein
MQEQKCTQFSFEYETGLSLGEEAQISSVFAPGNTFPVSHACAISSSARKFPDPPETHTFKMVDVQILATLFPIDGRGIRGLRIHLSKPLKSASDPRVLGANLQLYEET